MPPQRKPSKEVVSSMFRSKKKGVVDHRSILIAALLLILVTVAGLSLALSQEIKYSQDPGAAKRMTLLLKDYDPKSMLHVPGHEVPRAKFPVIDVHNHVNDAGGVHGEDIPPAEVVRRMDATNVKKIVILTGMWGDK